MTDGNTNRRKVLHSIGAVGLAGVSTNISAAKERSEQQIGRQSLLEIGIKFDVNEEHPYSGFYSEGIPPYYLPPSDEKIVLPSNFTPEVVINTFVSSKPVVNGTSIESTPTRTVTPTRIDALPVELTSKLTPYKLYSLDKPLSLPAIRVSSNDDTEYVIASNGRKKTVGADQSNSIELPEKRVSIVTSVHTDEKVEIPGVPEREWGHRRETDTVDVAVKPRIKFAHRGERPVVTRTIGETNR